MDQTASPDSAAPSSLYLVILPQAAMGRPRTPSQHDESTLFWGYVMVTVSMCWFVGMMFNIAGAKFLLPTGNVLFDFLTTDWYYPCLIVLCIPSTLVAVYLNWLAMKFFVHN